MAEFTKMTTLAGELVYVNKDHIVTVVEEWRPMDIGEEPHNVTLVKLTDGTEFPVNEEINSLMYRLNKNEMEAAVDRLLAHDADGKVVVPQ